MDNVPIYVFYHAFCINDCFDRFSKTFEKIKNSNLLDKVSKIYVILVGDDKYIIENKIKNFDKVETIIKNDCSSEIETLDFIYKKSKLETFKCLYIHSKGVSHGGQILENINCWIEYLEYFLILQSSICIEKLSDFSVCGVDYRINPEKHFCGNFWWANSNYIKNLIDPSFFINNKVINIYLTKRHNCEFWIGNKLNNNYFTLHQPPNEFPFYKQKININSYKI